jgi:DNA invertase Pin-like site-specific DNA recombinase
MRIIVCSWLLPAIIARRFVGIAICSEAPFNTNFKEGRMKTAAINKRESTSAKPPVPATASRLSPGGATTGKRPVAIYLRVSTNSQSTDAQLAELTQLVERRGWKYRVFCDRGQSGAKESRPAFDDMMREIRRGHLSAVCIWALDRLARSLRQLLEISQELQRLNVDLVAVKQDLDTSSPTGRLVYSVLACVAEFERELLRERVRSGLAQARRNGKRLGRPPLRVLTLEEVNTLRTERARTKKSYRELSRKFGVSVFTVHSLCASHALRTSSGKARL